MLLVLNCFLLLLTFSTVVTHINTLTVTVPVNNTVRDVLFVVSLECDVTVHDINAFCVGKYEGNQAFRKKYS